MGYIVGYYYNYDAYLNGDDNVHDCFDDTTHTTYSFDSSEPASITGYYSEPFTWYRADNLSKNSCVENFEPSMSVLNLSGAYSKVVEPIFTKNSYVLDIYNYDIPRNSELKDCYRYDDNITVYLGRSNGASGYGLSSGAWSYKTFKLNLKTNADSSENDIIKYSTDGKNISHAKIGYYSKDNSFIYEDNVGLYIGGKGDNTLKLNSDNSRNIWLNGSQGITYSNVNNIDASESTGDNQLAGNSSDNEIRAGSGNDLLWGGVGGNDTLYGGTGDNTFYYGINEGSDVIYNSVSTDKVDLYNVSFTDIYSYSFDGSRLRFNMAGGESLVIEGSDGASNFVLADRSEYSYNRSTDTWSVKA